MSTVIQSGGQEIFGPIRNLQLTTHLMLFKIKLTPPVEELYSGLADFTGFDYYEAIQEIAGVEIYLIDYSPAPPFSIEFDQVGYGSVNTFDNLGAQNIMLVYFAFLGLVMGLLALLALVAKGLLPSSRVHTKLTAAKNSIQLTQLVLIFMISSFFEMALIIMIYYVRSPDVQLLLTNFDDRYPLGDWTQIVTSTLLFVFLVVAFVYSLYFFKYKFRELSQHHQKVRQQKRFGAFLDKYARHDKPECTNTDQKLKSNKQTSSTTADKVHPKPDTVAQDTSLKAKMQLKLRKLIVQAKQDLEMQQHADQLNQDPTRKLSDTDANANADADPKTKLELL